MQDLIFISYFLYFKLLCCLHIFASLLPDTGFFQYLGSVYFNFSYDFRFNTKKQVSQMNAIDLPHNGDSPIPCLRNSFFENQIFWKKGGNRPFLKNACEERRLLYFTRKISLIFHKEDFCIFNYSNCPGVSLNCNLTVSIVESVSLWLVSEK